MNPFEETCRPATSRAVHGQAHLAARHCDPVRPAVAFPRRVDDLRARLRVRENPNIPSVVGIDYLVDGAPSPAAIAGVQAGRRDRRRSATVHKPDAVRRSVRISWPTSASRSPYVLDRDGERVHVTMTPVADADRRPGRCADRHRDGTASRDRARSPRSARRRSGVGHHPRVGRSGSGTVFGPAGVKQMLTLLFTINSARRRHDRRESLVGVGQHGRPRRLRGRLGLVLHDVRNRRAVPRAHQPAAAARRSTAATWRSLLIEKVRHKRIDMKKLVPVSAAVLVFLGFFVDLGDDPGHLEAAPGSVGPGTSTPR